MHPSPGISHGCEPDDFDHGLAFEGESWSGCLWEADGSPEDPVPTIGDFLESARATHGLVVEDLVAAWVAQGRRSVLDDARLVAACVRRALLAGHDVYDSDTRTFIFAQGERVDCRACPECRGKARGGILRG